MASWRWTDHEPEMMMLINDTGGRGRKTAQCPTKLHSALADVMEQDKETTRERSKLGRDQR